ncbi:UDP-N-acetylmuramate dehydrogenase [Terracidiphilus gabretensis]|jgi:UDP-N-acetylmuramate dehydrogenase|uniref:UDP-N-acetylmuramate dehydrogenase n=1 Tax=Terracidiphilus gabretensis TaxID=1577687 RepID=UPI00071B3AD4|nr:UDP-N-acetylmuramate dehydrogenase [Terracidiphilus gabretensis]
MHLIENKPLAPLTTLGVGGPARYFLETRSEEEILEGSAWAQKHGIPLFVLGGGSNLVVSDKGFDGLVLHIALHGVEVIESESADQVLFRVAAGEDWDSFVQQTVEAGSAGIECLAGIPGTVGGTPVQNVGAYGQEVASVIERVRVFDQEERAFVEFSAAESEFTYRRSRFNSTDKGRYIVTRVDFRLQHGGSPTLKYADLQRLFAADATPTLVEVAAAVRRIRQNKGMLLVEGDADCRSAGSFFKNPIVPVQAMQTITSVAGTSPPTYDAGPNERKIPAAWLIEQAGFTKGSSRGAVGISTRHTLALVNRGGATAEEILEFAEEIRAAVASRFGVTLEMEPVQIGF